MAIIAGLSHSSVSRLKDSWAALSTKSRTAFEELESLMQSRQNYKLYRQNLALASKEGIRSK